MIIFNNSLSYYLWVLGDLLGLELLNTLDIDWDSVSSKESSVSWRELVNEFLIDSPDLVPVHLYDGSGRSLSDNELLERLDAHATAEDAANGRETRVVPSANFTRVNEPGELALRENRVLQVKARVLVYVRLTHIQCIQEPHVLLVAVVVLRCAKCVGHLF